jgi:hypothetical protein
MVAPKGSNIPEEMWTPLGISLYEGIVDSLSDRQQFDELLDYYNDLYEMNTQPTDDPWPGAASICVPLVATMTETVISRLASAVFVPRLFIVNGNTSDAAQTQHEVERYYNAEFRRNKYLPKMLEGLHRSALDGTHIMECLWKKKVTNRKVLVYEPDPSQPDGNGNFKKVGKVQEIEMTDWDAFDPQPVELRDFIVGPAWAKSIEEAEFVARKLMLTENQLNEMVEAGTLKREWVERAIQYLTNGDNELGSDPQGTATYELGGTINIGNAGTMTPESSQREPGYKMRGALRVWRVHSNQYDLDGDGFPEENVFWVHDNSQLLLGYEPYAYWHGRRPFARLCLMPRPGRFYGFGVPERLRSIQEEMNAQHNQRLNYMDLILQPTIYEVDGVQPEDDKHRWGPHARFKVTKPDDIGIVQVGDVPPSTWQQEVMLMRYAGQLVGLEGPGMPMTGNQKIPAKQQQAYQQSANIRLDLMALNVREWIEEIFWQWHHLNLQFGKETMQTTDNSNGQPERLNLDKATLAKDYEMAVAGMEGPLDRDNRRMDTLTLYSLLLQNPLVQGNLARVWSATMMVLEEFNRPDVPAIIGTMQDALNQQQQQAQAAQQQQEMQMKLAMIEHMNNNNGGGGKPQAKPPQPLQRPQSPGPAEPTEVQSPQQPGQGQPAQ